MTFSYAPLWETLYKKKISKNKFKKICKFSNNTISQLVNNENTTVKTLDKICNKLNCNIEDIVMHVDNSVPLFCNPKYDIKTGLSTISLFSGAGGLDLGLKKAGFNIVYANDNYAPAVENYLANIGNIENKDIRKVNENELPYADVVVGGFPCQPFSTAGNRKGTDDDRGNLYLDVIRVIKAKKPKIVIMENVRGLLSMKNKDGSKLIYTIVSILENVEPGYVVKYKLLKASDYEVPENRFRVIIIAFRKDLKIDYHFPKPTTKDYKKLTLKHILNVSKDIPNQNEVWDLSPQSQKLVDHIPEGGSWKDIPYDLLPDRLKRIRDNMKRYHSPNFYRRFGRDEINGTITAAATPENSGIVHPVKNRRYTVREIARIQSFPDDYIFVGSSIPAKYKVIGNAVPPKLAEIIGDSVVKALHDNNL
ncbi:DNA (cytosine-5-)-methyltransferase [Lactobacillus sp. ESL0236]|nr:DNA (cytosine-5-)-methyltransferase [Lactobacillus sp. ESL0237]RMC45702.1 DNA (cytosine-5-)-methyltransferase [Lactobacillus sp. ESL0234]RMC47163.1 DNA (cytosine-5-)-methyltransferase [Lactobacillus sp. ESL0236]